MFKLTFTLSISLVFTALAHASIFDLAVEQENEAIVGQYLKLHCSGSIDQKDIFRAEWSKDGEWLSSYFKETNLFVYNASMKHVKPEFLLDKVSSLVLKNVEYQSSGNYSCSVTQSGRTSYEKKSPSKKIVVKEDKDEMEVKILTTPLKSSEEEYLMPNKSMYLACSYATKGEVESSITWKKDGIIFMSYNYILKTYSKGSDVKGIEYDLSKSRNGNIYLSKTYMNTTGKYTCEITKKDQEKMAASRYVVINKEPHTSSHAIRFKIPNNQKHDSPVVGYNLKLQYFDPMINENNTLVEVIWYKNFIPFYQHTAGESPKLSIQGQKGLQNLVVKSDFKIENFYVTKETAGEYMIEVVTELKTDSMKEKYNLYKSLKYISFVQKFDFPKIDNDYRLMVVIPMAS